ncbi:hypothetical protein QYF36_011202 [Acer negundo]|nr:hypothetical protein QYF36_011202 [Acer negundo]
MGRGRGACRPKTKEEEEEEEEEEEDRINDGGAVCAGVYWCCCVPSRSQFLLPCSLSTPRCSFSQFSGIRWMVARDQNSSPEMVNDFFTQLEAQRLYLPWTHL